MVLGKVYLSTGETLLHGDYYPGSWLENNGQTYIIDPEFGFHGVKEFDLGVFIAHLMLSSQPQKNLTRMISGYGKRSDFDEGLAVSFAGIEILRRLMGVAQLPLSADLSTKTSLIEKGKNMVLHPDRNYLIS